jgi:hypothetical protein
VFDPCRAKTWSGGLMCDPCWYCLWIEEDKSDRKHTESFIKEQRWNLFGFFTLQIKNLGFFAFLGESSWSVAVVIIPHTILGCHTVIPPHFEYFV